MKPKPFSALNHFTVPWVMSFPLPCCRIRTDGRRSRVAAPTGRTERNVRQRRLSTFGNEAEAQQRPGATVRDDPPPWGRATATGWAPSGDAPGQHPVRARRGVPMDITTVNDRHLYQGRVGEQDPADPDRSGEDPRRNRRFAPDRW